MSRAEELQLQPQDIIIIKPKSSFTHSLYFLRNLEHLGEFLDFFKSKFLQEDCIGPKDVQMILQVGSPHFGLCVKHYYFAGVHVFNYQESLAQSYFDKSQPEKFGELIRKFKYDQSSPVLDLKVKFACLKRFMNMVKDSARYEAIGLDYIIRESD